MITIKITRKDQPDGIQVTHQFERSRIGKLHEDIVSEINGNVELRHRIGNILLTHAGDIIDIYARNYVKDCWVKILDMKTV